MIKYARTKDDKIIKIDTENDVFTSKYEIVGNPVYEIKDLCDVFVKKSKEEGNDYFNIGKDDFIVCDIKYCNYKRWFNVYDYYGAIWTDKGLIYVAKMNKEGKFELL